MDVVHWPRRPCPQTWQLLAATAVANQHQRWRDRQCRCRPNCGNVHQDGGGGVGLQWGMRRHRTSVWRSANHIRVALSQLLHRIGDPQFKVAILEKVFTSPNIRTFLSHYYPIPEQARAQHQILQDIHSDLVAMKIPHSSGMLAPKRAILEAMVSELDSDMTKFHSILRTRKENLVAVVEWLRSATAETSSRYTVPARKKREGGISEEVRAFDLQWWTKETRISPRCRDVCRKRLGRSSYDTHATHLLLENQVLLFLSSFLQSSLCSRMLVLDSATTLHVGNPLGMPVEYYVS